MPSSLPMVAAMAGAQLVGSSMSANASENAAQDQMQAALAGLAAQETMYNTARTDLAPYRAAGAGALSSLNKLLGITPAKTTPNPKFNFPTAGGGGGGILGGLGHMLGGLAPHGLGGLAAPFSGLGSIGLATGGPAQGGAGGRDYIVGEEGPEILHMAPGAQGHVTPNPGTMSRMMMGGRAIGGPVGSNDPTGNMANFNAYRPPVNQRVTMPYSNPITQSTGGGATTTGAGGALAANAHAASGGGAQNTIMQFLKQQPEYQFVLRQGIHGLDSSALAAGGMLTGGHMKAIMNYSQGLASNTFQQIVNNLSNVASLGASASSMTGQNGIYSGMGMGNLLSQFGQAAGSGAVGSANAWGGGMQNLAMLSAMYGNGGTGG